MRQNFEGPVGQVAAGNITNVNLGPGGGTPPCNPNVSRTCPQCQEITWRRTRACRHCHFDLFEFDRLVLAEQRRKRALKLALGLGIVGLALVFVIAPNLNGTPHMVALAFGGAILGGMFKGLG